MGGRTERGKRHRRCRRPRRPWAGWAGRGGAQGGTSGSGRRGGWGRTPAPAPGGAWGTGKGRRVEAGPPPRARAARNKAGTPPFSLLRRFLFPFFRSAQPNGRSLTASGWRLYEETGRAQGRRAPYERRIRRVKGTSLRSRPSISSHLHLHHLISDTHGLCLQTTPTHPTRSPLPHKSNKNPLSLPLHQSFLYPLPRQPEHRTRPVPPHTRHWPGGGGTRPSRSRRTGRGGAASEVDASFTTFTTPEDEQAKQPHPPVPAHRAHVSGSPLAPAQAATPRAAATAPPTMASCTVETRGRACEVWLGLRQSECG